LTWALKTLVAAYVLALAALPLAHHDLLCHLKSSTHCATCHIGTSDDSGGSDPAVAPVVFVDAGLALELTYSAVASPSLLPSAGRSPPSGTF
jgi:hypothetical protein